MASFVQPHPPLITSRIRFELNNSPPLLAITPRMNFTRNIRRNEHEARSLCKRRVRQFSAEVSRASTPMSGIERDETPLTSLGGSDDSSEDARLTPPPLTKQNQIPKPPGEAGRRNCGGFNLESALNWEGNKYRRMMVSSSCFPCKNLARKYELNQEADLRKHSDSREAEPKSVFHQPRSGSLIRAHSDGTMSFHDIISARHSRL